VIRWSALQDVQLEQKQSLKVLRHVRIPDDADQRSGMKPITIPF
jgi:hypothetical protein